MPLSFQCEICRRPIRVADGSEGQMVYCPGCYSLLTVPYRSGEPHSTDDPLQAGPEDPLGIRDPENLTPQAEASASERENPFAATVERRLPPASPSSRQARYRAQLVFCAMVVMATTGIGSLLVATEIVWGTLAILNGDLNEPLGNYLARVPFLFAHLATILGLNEARRLGSYPIAWSGVLLSLVPCANPSFYFVVPPLLSLWCIVNLTRPEVKALFRSEPHSSTE